MYIESGPPTTVEIIIVPLPPPPPPPPPTSVYSKPVSTYPQNGSTKVNWTRLFKDQTLGI